MLERMPKVEPRPAKGKYRLGEERLLKGAERIRTPSEEVQKFRGINRSTKPEKVIHMRGELRLKKRRPGCGSRLSFGWEDVLEDYGLSSVRSLLTALGILKYTKTFGGLVGLEVGAKEAVQDGNESLSQKIDKAITRCF